YALYPFLDERERMTSVEFKVNFLVPATVDRGEVVARSSVVRRGRTLAVAQVDVRQADQLVLTGIFTYIVLQEQRPVIPESEARTDS
ncbi:MAG: PaaI family thioesterase, partial [Acidimicrobiia bacterium]